MTEPQTVPADTLPVGRRRDLIARIDVEIEVMTAAMDLAIDNGDYAGATDSLAALRRLRGSRAWTLTCHEHELPRIGDQ